MAKRAKTKIIFHIGLEKTGTTSFQAFCTDHHALLHRRSILYPTRNLGFFGNNHEPLVACYFPRSALRHLMMRSPHRDKTAILRSLNREIQGAAVDTILISAEHFSSRFSADQIRELAEDFSDYDCRIVIVLRDHVSRALSAYSTSIVSGRHLTLEEFVAEICDPANIYIRYKDIITLWETVFGRNNISIIPYKERDDVIKSMINYLMAEDFTSRCAKNYIRKESLGASALESLRLINDKLSQLQRSGAPRAHFEHALTRIFYGFKRRMIKDSGARLRFSEDQIRRLEDIAEVDRRWLEDFYGLQLDDRSSRYGVR
jgi:hypothetical protein